MDKTVLALIHEVLFIQKKPSLGRVAASAFHNDRHGKPSDVECDPHSLHLLSEVVAKTAPYVQTASLGRPEGPACLYLTMRGRLCQKMSPGRCTETYNFQGIPSIL